MTTCQGSALLLGIEHLDAGAPDRINAGGRQHDADGCDSDSLLRLLGPELHRDPAGIERAL